MKLEGVIPPLTTPFDDGGFSPEKLREMIARYEKSGVHGYLLLGSSGEAAYLQEKEKVAVLRTARAAIPAGKPMLAGVGLESTAGTIRLARIAADCGADFVLVLTPHYFDGLMDGEALASHYRAVADASPVPVLLYNVPKFTHVEIPVETILSRSEHENIAGVKESSGDLERLTALVRGPTPGFKAISGHAGTFPAALAGGVKAAVLAAADVFPETYVAIHHLVVEGKKSRAESLHRAVSPASRLAVSIHGVPGIKAGMDLRGLYGGPPRPPLLPLAEPAREELRREIGAIEETGVLAGVP